MTSSFDSAAFRRVMGCFATGVAVATARNETLGAFGLTINSLTSVSLEPALILFCLDKKAHLHSAFLDVDAFAINFLTAQQENVSRHFADRRHNPAPSNMWAPKPKSAPLLDGSLGWVVCQPFAQHDGGDHTIFVGRVTDLCKSTGVEEPLLYFEGRYREFTVTSGARK